jgi:beta-lactamase class C
MMVMKPIRRKWLQYNMGIAHKDHELLKLQQLPAYQWTLENPPAHAGEKTCAPDKPLPKPIGTRIGWFSHSPLSDPSITLLTKNGGVGGFSSWLSFQSWVGTGKPSPIGAFVLTNNAGKSNAATEVGSKVMTALLT